MEYIVSMLNRPQKEMEDFLDARKEHADNGLYAEIEEKDMRAAYNFKNFIDGMPGSFFIYRADKTEEIIYANQATLRLFKFDTLEEFRALTGNTFRGIVHPDDLKNVEQSIREQIENSQYDLDYVEYRIIQKDGNIRWIEDYGHLVHSAEAGDMFYVFAGDATEKRQLQEEKRNSLLNRSRQKEQFLKNRIRAYDNELQLIHQEHLRRLEVIEGLSLDYESIFYVNLDKDRIQAYRVSKRFAKEFPPDKQNIKFSGFDADYKQNWVYPDDRVILRDISNPEYIRKKLKHAKSMQLHYRLLENGKTTYMQLHIVNVGDLDHVSQIVIGYRNVDVITVSEMKQKQMLSEALQEANLANKAKTLFLSNMSHDIRTPMNAIVNFTELVKKHMHDKEKAFKYLDSISSSSDQLLHLLNGILEISRIESGSMKLLESVCSLTGLLHQIQLETIPKADAKNITVTLDISSLKHDYVCVDHEKLSDILSYLIDNSVKYTNVNGRITITATEQENWKDGDVTYAFSVEDNGIGISEEFMDRLFQPFEREKNTTMSGIHGTGLGLAITKDLLEMMGGTIDVVSKPGEGSKFTITLSLKAQKTQPDNDATAAELKEGAAPSSDTRRILIVDDNEINLEIEREVLKEAGFLVEMAENGKIAMDKVQSSVPGYYDLILMDIQMPVMDGYHATREIRKIENPALSGIPIIAVSANTFEEDKRMAMESGMNAHLPKPLDTNRLYKLIKKFLKN